MSRDESPEGDLRRQATQASIDYLYKHRRESEGFQLAILAQLCQANGCSSAPDFCFGDCCNEHDVAYSTGKTIEGRDTTRQLADARLLACMSRKARTDAKAAEILAPIYHAVVRVFGESHWIDYVPREPSMLPLPGD